jgi:hypothetical protein
MLNDEVRMSAPLKTLRRLLDYVIGLWRQPHWWAA